VTVSSPSFFDEARKLVELVGPECPISRISGQAFAIPLTKFSRVPFGPQFMRAAPVRLQGRTIMNRSTLTTTALLGLAVGTALPQAGFAQAPVLPNGIYQLDLAKSKYSPGPSPKSNTLYFAGEG
jgi:hypothetical protein